MALRKLIPPEGQIGPAELATGLRLGEQAPPERPYLVLNMVATLDGKATVEGRTRAMSSEVDRELFHHLRTQVDAVMAGATTVSVEGYGRIVKSDELRAKREREGLEPDALAVVVSGSLNVAPEAPLFQEPEQRVVVITGADGALEGASSQLEYVRTDDLAEAMRLLRDQHGVRSVLCEGGPTLNSHLFAANLVDELFLSVSPQISGGTGAPTIVEGMPQPQPVQATLISLCEAENELFQRWRIC